MVIRNITGAFDGHGLILQFSPTANLVGGGMLDEFEFDHFRLIHHVFSSRMMFAIDQVCESRIIFDPNHISFVMMSSQFDNKVKR